MRVKMSDDLKDVIKVLAFVILVLGGIILTI